MNKQTKEENWEEGFIKREAVSISIFVSNRKMRDCIEFAENRVKIEKDILEQKKQKVYEKGFADGRQEKKQTYPEEWTGRIIG